MSTQSTLAEQIAREAHAGQFRRDDTTPYIAHPEAVANKLKARGADDVTVAAAWLHDVLEDTKLTVADLEARGICPHVTSLVLILTKYRSESYEHYLARVNASERAKQIKIADMLHNLSDSPSHRQQLKYAHGLLTLLW